MGILHLQLLSLSLLLKFTNASVKRSHFVFLLHEFRSRRDLATYAGLENLMKGSLLPKPVDVLRENPLYRKTFLVSTYFGLKTTRRVSLYLSDLEMNWT